MCLELNKLRESFLGKADKQDRHYFLDALANFEKSRNNWASLFITPGPLISNEIATPGTVLISSEIVTPGTALISDEIVTPGDLSPRSIGKKLQSP